MRFLVVDDNAGMRGMIRSILVSLGQDVFECASGALALETYQACRPDIVLMDVVMPGIDGLEATRRIKAGSPEARIVIVTDFDDPGMRLAGQQAGAEGYILKDDLSELESLCAMSKDQPQKEQ